MEKYLTVKEVSNTLSIGYGKVLDLIALGDLKAIKLGKVYRISPYALDQLIKSNEVKSFWKQ